MADIYELWKRYDTEQEQKLQKCPLCAICEEHIQDESATFFDEIGFICDMCINTHRKDIEV